MNASRPVRLVDAKAKEGYPMMAVRKREDGSYSEPGRHGSVSPADLATIHRIIPPKDSPTNWPLMLLEIMVLGGLDRLGKDRQNRYLNFLFPTFHEKLHQ